MSLVLRIGTGRGFGTLDNVVIKAKLLQESEEMALVSREDELPVRFWTAVQPVDR